MAVLVVSFFFPLLNFGRFYGTDDYTHLFHTREMSSSNGILDFYEKISTHVDNPDSETYLFNYPFGLWLFGSTISKSVGLPILSAEFIFVMIFLCILLGSFYIYSGLFLELKEQKIFAILFLLSMPTAALSILSYRPSLFILPFLLILMYIALKEPFQWKLLPIIWLSIFIITISHTGTFIFLISFSVVFFIFYSLFWGKFSTPIYIVVMSTLVIYIASLNWFPQIANQYEVKSVLFLSPGNFLASKFHFDLLSQIGEIFYQNLLVDMQYIYILIAGAFIFALGKLLIYIHDRILEKYRPLKSGFPVVIPSMSISKSVVGIPFWLGPIQLLFSIIGFFRIDSKGKCMFISIFLVTLTPDLISTSAGTGALREISYIILIIPVTAVLGLWAVISYLDSMKYSGKSLISGTMWVLLLSAIIITPTIATAYYLPKISGEDYIIDGMKWLGGTGDISEKVLGYGYRTVPIYTNKTDATYGIQNGYDLRTLLTLLKKAYISSEVSNVEDLLHYYGVNYILVSDKLAENLGNTRERLLIDNNPALDKIFSSRDFGIYKVKSLSDQPVQKKIVVDNISFLQTGSSIEVETNAYKVVLNQNYPSIERFGTLKDNYLGDGFMNDNIQISGFRQTAYVNPFIPRNESGPSQNSTVDLFSLNNLPVSAELNNNQVTYRTILKDREKKENEATLLVRYTFYPKTIKREFLISNDWVTSPSVHNMDVEFSTSLFVPMNDFSVIRNQTATKRHIFPSQDSVIKENLIRDLYVHDGNRGIYIESEPSAPYPSEITYKGSTLYNYSSIRLGQALSIKSGDTMHITQFLSAGDEVSAKKNILTQQGITLINYPDGMVPIILSGYRTPASDRGDTENIERGYQILRAQGIPYSEIIVPGNVLEIPPDLQNLTTSNNTQSLPVNQTSVGRSIDLRSIAQKNIGIIGSGSTGPRNFDNFSVQENSISSLLYYAHRDATPFIGYMPQSMNYNLDTLKIISDKGIPFILARFVTPPAYGSIAVRDRNPEMAIYHGEPVDVALIPASYPMSSSLSYDSDNAVILSAWKITIDDAIDDDGMAFFIFRSSEIGNPVFNETFQQLFSYAKEKGLVFSTPDAMVNHFRDLQKIQYHSFIDNDMASISVINDNDHLVQHVSFRVVLPALQSGSYKVSNGEIVRTKKGDNQVILYVSTDIPAHATQEITLEPDTSREKIVVTLPAPLTEGQISISIRDVNNKPLGISNVIIDSTYYKVDKEGNVKADLKRGLHSIKVQSPGYETYTSTVKVRGRIYLIGQYFGYDPDIKG